MVSSIGSSNRSRSVMSFCSYLRALFLAHGLARGIGSGFTRSIGTFRVQTGSSRSLDRLHLGSSAAGEPAKDAETHAFLWRLDFLHIFTLLTGQKDLLQGQRNTRTGVSRHDVVFKLFVV